MTAVLLVLAGLEARGPVRTLLALAFVSFVPGWALLDWGPFELGRTKVVLAIILSLTICTGLALAQLWLEFWRPQMVFDLAAASAMVAMVLHLRAGDRS